MNKIHSTLVPSCAALIFNLCTDTKFWIVSNASFHNFRNIIQRLKKINKFHKKTILHIKNHIQLEVII